MAPPQKTLTFRDIDASSGQVTAIYIASTTDAGTDRADLRFDQVPRNATSHPDQGPTTQSTTLPSWRIYLTAITSYLQTLFLPTGYPHSVTPDYTPYQIYDSLQAFASSIAGLLSSRAVLQSLNVVSPDTDSATAATAATLLSIAQNTLSNLTTILFASYAAPRVSADVKFYRFLADVVNDTAFVLDLLAPTLPERVAVPIALGGLLNLTASPRVLVLCTSSMLRAVCGVAGGSSKAVLSAHFARNNPESVGDLNAKDGSQETVVGLVGMWIGGLVVSRVEGVAATWCWMIGLLGCHLWANYRAVKSVRLTGLNRERAHMVLQALMNGGDLRELSVDAVGARESVLGLRRLCSSLLSRYFTIGHGSVNGENCQIGVSSKDFYLAIKRCLSRQDTRGISEQMTELLKVFNDEVYLLWYDRDTRTTTIALKASAQPIHQLKAYFHALVIQKGYPGKQDDGRSQVVGELSRTLGEVNESWAPTCQGLEKLGWVLSAVSLEDGKGIRVDVGC